MSAARRPTREPAMRFVVERGPDLATTRRQDPWPTLLFPLGTSAITVEGLRGVTHLDRASLALVPAETTYRLAAKGALTELLTLALGPSARARASREYRGDIDPERLDALFAKPRLLPRTRWVDEVAHRYLFEREVCRKEKSLAATFLEVEIVKELYFLCREQDAAETRASVVHEEDDVARRARTWIDEHLFEPFCVRDLAKRSGTSESTLLRVFRREVGTAPASYVRERRLDASLLLLRSERYSVGEVAARVGYASLAAFTAAFGKRFGEPPSSFRRVDADLARLPPHGEAPRATETRKALTRPRKARRRDG